MACNFPVNLFVFLGYAADSWGGSHEILDLLLNNPGIQHLHIFGLQNTSFLQE
jgi:hypothetical protein